MGFWMVTLKAHILPHPDLQPPGCRGSCLFSFDFFVFLICDHVLM
ncbi:hypothetical protein AC17_5036 [Escherichia coli 2-210-07_S3_C2]|nr:hypothetical protein AC17_5036 [Escherichia coli 2-210-07_S3_C2]